MGFLFLFFILLCGYSFLSLDFAREWLAYHCLILWSRWGCTSVCVCFFSCFLLFDNLYILVMFLINCSFAYCFYFILFYFIFIFIIWKANGSIVLRIGSVIETKKLSIHEWSDQWLNCNRIDDIINI